MLKDEELILPDDLDYSAYLPPCAPTNFQNEHFGRREIPSKPDSTMYTRRSKTNTRSDPCCAVGIDSPNIETAIAKGTWTSCMNRHAEFPSIHAYISIVIAILVGFGINLLARESQY